MNLFTVTTLTILLTLIPFPKAEVKPDNRIAVTLVKIEANLSQAIDDVKAIQEQQELHCAW